MGERRLEFRRSNEICSTTCVQFFRLHRLEHSADAEASNAQSHGSESNETSTRIEIQIMIPMKKKHGPTIYYVSFITLLHELLQSDCSS